MCITSCKTPFQAQLGPVHAGHHIALLQRVGLPRCKRWVLLHWAGSPCPAPPVPQVLPASLHPQPLSQPSWGLS